MKGNGNVKGTGNRMGNRKGRVRRALRAFALVGMAACLVPIGQAWYQSVQHKAQQEGLRKAVVRTEAQHSVPEVGAAPGAAAPLTKGEAVAPDRTVLGEAAALALAGGVQSVLATGEAIAADPAWQDKAPAMLEKYVDLYAENEELVGWLSIEGTRIDYPVLQNEDDMYYLHHDFYGQDSKHGCLYVKERADLERGTNFIIYGHNKKDGSMFGDLDLYQKEDFYREHPSVSFDTLYEERTYDVMAVFRSQVYNEEDDVFKYYRFYEAQTQEEFDDFYDNVKALSLYDTGVEAQFGDTFLTLSTCAYHVKDGRFVVVAKRRK